MDFIISSDGHKLYKATCRECGSDRGYQRKNKLSNVCSSCASIKKIMDKGNPMKGRKHVNKERFRKNTFDNVDYDDKIIEYSKSGNKRTKYKQVCPQCRTSVGYRVHFDAKRLCKKCRDLNATHYTVEQKRIRCSMKANLFSRLKNRLLNKNKKSTFGILGYSVDDLIKHLESKFQSGMTWDNYGEWEIDHVTPDSWFEYNSIDDNGFKQSWALNNLQPLWKKDNATKSNKYEG